MKKKIRIAIIILFLFILLVPIPIHLNDGGTVEYTALIYKISKVHRLNHNSKSGYDDGLIISIFGKQIYNRVSKSVGEDNEKKEVTPNYSKKIDQITLEINIPNEWKYEELSQDEKNDFYKYALKLYKSQNNKNAILYFYHDPFGVCGTGRTTKELLLDSGEKASIGYYGSTEWNDISFFELNPNIAFINNGLDENEANEVLDFVKTLTIK